MAAEVVQGNWTTADYALVISLFSAFLSLASFVWNVWSKFIFPKPRLATKIQFSYFMGDESDDVPGCISLEIVNHGPGDIQLKGVYGWVRQSFFGKPKRALLRAYTNWPHSLEQASIGMTPGLPRKLGIGEQATVLFPEGILINKGLINLGFVDGFERLHMADASSARNLRRAVRTHK